MEQQIAKWRESVGRLMDASDWMDEVIGNLEQGHDKTKLTVIQEHMYKELCGLSESIGLEGGRP